MSTQKIAVVVSSHLEEYWHRFLAEWKEEFALHNITVYLNEDHQKKTFTHPKMPFPIKHYSWDDHEKDLKKNAWIISRKTSAGKSYGFWKAYQDGAQIILSLDHDCYPDQKNTVQQHLDALNTKVTFGFMPSVSNTPTRGFPYEIRDKTPVVVNHGVWSNIPDYDGPQMLQFPHDRFPVVSNESTLVPKGTYFPLCGMNFAFERKTTPAQYFLLMGPDWPFDRFDDIWAGFFLKKITDHLGEAILTGSPSIHHDKGTNPFVAVQKEASGLPVNEWLWQEIDAIPLTKQTYAECYQELAQGLLRSEKVQASSHKAYFDKLSEAMNIWAELFL